MEPPQRLLIEASTAETHVCRPLAPVLLSNQNDIEQLGRELLLNYFWKFSVLEFALKRAGFLKEGRDGSAHPDWISFGTALRGTFASRGSAELRDAVAEINRLSPRRQIVRDGQLAWAEVEPRRDATVEEHTLVLLRTVRNNLFHGGKYPGAAIAEVARDREILRASLVVLNALATLHPDLAKAAVELHPK